MSVRLGFRACCTVFLSASRPDVLLLFFSLCGVCLLSCTSSQTQKRIKPVTGYWHTVKTGENWATLKKRHQLNVDDVRAINGLAASSELTVGQKVFLFGVRGSVKTSPRLSSTPSKKKPVLKAVKSRQLPPQKKKWAYPIRGARLTSKFGKRGNRPHKGIDLAAKMGTPIYATADGEVIYSGSRQRGYGNLVILKHKNGYVSVYAHNRRNLVDEGQKVRQGFQIAELGNSGRSTGPHLHFEIRYKGKPLDPLRLIGKKP